MAAPKGNNFAAQRKYRTPVEYLLRDRPKRDWIAHELRRPRGMRTVAKYNEFRMLNDSNIIKPEQTKELAQIYRPETNQPELSVKTFLRNDQVQEYANKELIQRYIELGWTVSEIATKKNEIYTKAIEEKQLNVALRTVESIENNLGVSHKVTISETRQTNSNLVDNFNKAKQTITVTSEKQGQINQNTSSINDDNKEKTRENTLPDAENEQKTENEG